MKYFSYHAFLLILFQIVVAAWSPLSASKMPETKVPAKPTIVGISPKRATPGMPISIQLDGFINSAFKGKIVVRFDGVEADIQSQEPGYLTVIVPNSLTNLNSEPQIIVSSLDFEDQRASASGYLQIVFPDKNWLAQTVFVYPNWAWLMVLAALLIIFIIILVWRRSVYKLDAVTLHSEDQSPTEAPILRKSEPVDVELPDPSMPDELVRAIVQGNVVAHLGAGLAAQSGLPTWTQLMGKLLEELERGGHLQKSQTASLQTVLQSDKTEYAAEALIQLLKQTPMQINEAIKKVYSIYDAEPSNAHQYLAKLPFAAWSNGNFDSLFEKSLEQAHGRHKIPEYTPKESDKALDRLSQGDPFLFKPYGDLQGDISPSLGVQQYIDQVLRNAAFEELLDKLFLTQTLFFVGTSLQGIEDFMRGIEVRSTATRRHYALVVVEDPSWDLKSQVLLERFGIQVIPISYGTRDHAVANFLKSLHIKVAEVQKRVKNDKLAYGTLQSSWLNKINLKNVGPFKDLSLELDRHWNLILGDNGVGKSTVLKAIAVALCGEDSVQFAERIIRTDSTMAEILLHAGDENYTTTIKRGSYGGVKIKSVNVSAMDQERWLAIAFPALRTTSWHRSRSEGSLGTRRPTTADILPILSDEPDPRLDNLKQRIVTLDHLRKTEQLEGSGKGGIGRLMDDFFQIFDDITEGMNVTFKSVNPQTREITIKTEDGDIPFEALSQGTISLLGWVGVLLQRLYEVTPEGEDPHKRYVIVMIDEIDAHMHPAWQATIVNDLSKIFPHAQFIATTHSPLIVRGKSPTQVIRLKRNDDGAVEKVDIPNDMTMGRADQVLAGSLFDLDADLDEMTEEYIEKYQRLLGKTERTEDEEKEFINLEKILEYRIPVPMTSPPDRRALELLTTLLEEQISLPDSEASETIKKKAKALFSELQKEYEKVHKRLEQSS